MTISFERARRGALALAAAAICAPAYAQDAAPPAAPAAQPAPAQTGVEEIIITSTKREANIQDVPIAVSAFSADDLQSRGVSEFEEIEEVSPSIQVNTSNGAGANSTIRVRGVGTTGNNPGLEAAVGVFIDGVYRSRSGQAFTDLLDIERIEVLRGPQGTLFGKNTSAGAISVVTKKPVLEGQEGFAQLELGNFSDKRVAATHSAPIIDGVLGYRLSGSWQQRDGYYKNANGPGAWNDRDRFTLRGQLLFEPTDKLDARLILDLSERHESCCPASTLIDGPTSNRVNGFGGQELAASLGLGKDFIDIPLTVQPPAGSYPFVRKQHQLRQVGLNSAPFEDVKDEGAQLELNYDLDFAKATSITAFRMYGSHQGQDIDFTSADILNGDHLRDWYKNWSQEIRFAGTAFERFDWLVGFYGYTEHIFNRERLEFGSQAGIFALQSPVAAPSLPQGAGYFAKWRQNTGGYAFFTNNTIHIFEPLSFTFGVRYSKEQKSAVGIINNGAIASRNGVPTGYLTLGAPVPLGVNDAVTGGLVPGNAGWCEELSLVPSLAPVRTVLRGFCDNASWKNTKTEREVTGTASLSYAITEDINVYTSYSRGYKAGGFNLDQESVDIVTCGTFAGCQFPAVTGPIYPVGTVMPSALTSTGIIDTSHFKPEFANAYELGVKGVYLDGKARVNVAGFWTNFEDFQLNTFNGLGFTISNVGKVTTKGVELETTLIPAEGLVTTLGVTFADARYDKKSNVVFPITLPTGAASSVVAANKNLTNAPKWTGALGVNYEHTLPKTEWVGYLGGNVRYSSKRNTGSNLHPFKVEPHHFFLNMNVGVRSPSGRWDAQLWANNLTDEYENNIIFDSVFQTGSQGAFFNAPRMWGATLKYNFGERE